MSMYTKLHWAVIVESNSAITAIAMNNKLDLSLEINFVRSAFS